MQIQYKLNYPKQDRHSKLTWQPGDVKNVSPALAEKLLSYPDTWEKVEGEEAVGEEIGLPEQVKPTEEPLPVIDFHGMNKQAMLEFAETKYNERIDKRLSEESIRHKVIALFTKNEMADEADR